MPDDAEDRTCASAGTQAPDTAAWARSVLVLAGQLLDVQAETGDPHSQAAVEEAVEVLADRLITLTDRGMASAHGAGTGAPARQARCDPPPAGGADSPHRRVPAGDPASCSAASAMLRRTAVAVPEGPAWVHQDLAGAREDLLLLADALQQHAAGLAEVQRLWRSTASWLVSPGLRMTSSGVQAVSGAAPPEPERLQAGQARLDRMASMAGRAHAQLARAARQACRTTVSS